MPTFKDYSKYKKNELSTYLIKKEFTKYLTDKDKKKKKESNPFTSSIFSSIITALVTFTYGKKILDGSLTSKLITTDTEINEKIITALLTILFALGLAILFYIINSAYFYFFTPKMNSIVNKVKGFINAHQSNLDELAEEEDLKDSAYLDKFNHQVADRIALVITITNKFSDSQQQTPEAKFYLSDAFQSFKKALETLELDIVSHTFYAQKVKTNQLENFKSFRVNEIVQVSENILNKYKDFWAKEGDKNYMGEVQYAKSVLDRIKTFL
jgi:hypothetical protein